MSSRRSLWRLRHSPESSSNEEPLSRSVVAEPTERPILGTTSFDVFNQENLWAPPTPVQRTKQRTPETTHTSDSNQTVPETSESIEEPVANPLEQKTLKKPTIDINTMSSSINKMDVDETERKGELKLNQPKPFTGKIEDFSKISTYIYT